MNPSVFRCSATISIQCVIPTVISSIWRHRIDEWWWHRGNAIEVFVLIAALDALVWFACVPSVLEYSTTGVTIQLPLRQRHCLIWEDLVLYGSAAGMFRIHFTGKRCFTIYSFAYTNKEWKPLAAFLETSFPDKKHTQFG
jgi:hypothetical protein